jgi:streptogramin lyase
VPALRRHLRTAASVAAGVAALALAGAPAAAAGGIAVTTFSGLVEMGSIAADRAGNVYVMSDVAGLRRYAPDGTRSDVSYDAPPPEFGSPTTFDVIWGPDDALWFRCNRAWICHVEPGAGTTDAFPLTPGPMAAGPDGNVWFPDASTNSIARITPSGAVARFALPGPNRQAGRPALGADGNLWFPEPGINAVGRITPNGTITEFALPEGAVLPTTYTAGGITGGPDGSLWLALVGGIGKMSLSGQLVGRYDGVAETPYDIAPGPDGDVWFTEQGANRYGRITPSGRITEYDRKLYSLSLPSAIVTAADGALWTFAWIDPVVWRIDPEPPGASTGDPSGVGVGHARLTGLVEPRGGPATSWFEYGTTTSYGSRTAEQDAGDGDGGVLTATDVDGLGPRTTYHYRLVVRSGMRTTHGAEKTLTTAAVPVVVAQAPAPAAVDPDADGDGYPASIDCDDRLRAIHPGATDAPGDALDQDCSGAAATFTRFSPPADARWTTSARGTRFTKLVLAGVPAGATVTLTCRGRGCAFARFSTRTRRAAARVDLLGRLERSRLRRGAVVELRLAFPGQTTTILRWTVGPPVKRTTTCLAPGARKASACVSGG